MQQARKTVEVLLHISNIQVVDISKNDLNIQRIYNQEAQDRTVFNMTSSQARGYCAALQYLCLVISANSGSEQNQAIKL